MKHGNFAYLVYEKRIINPSWERENWNLTKISVSFLDAIIILEASKAIYRSATLLQMQQQDQYITTRNALCLWMPPN